jgi:hypothetical protein
VHKTIYRSKSGTGLRRLSSLGFRAEKSDHRKSIADVNLPNGLPSPQKSNSAASIVAADRSRSPTDWFGTHNESGADSLSDLQAMKKKPPSIARNRRMSSFNKLSAIQRIKRKAAKQEMKSIEEMKKQVLDYFSTQLYLAADLCLDRNYVAIGILENRLQYTLLLTILKTPSVPAKIKAPVCRILRSLHIDREPQVPVKFPRLIRTSISLSGGDEVSTAANPQAFALIQQIISDYIRHEMDTTKCDELSSEMMKLMESLMIFGFYSTPGQLHDILGPLIQALDDHRSSSWLHKRHRRNSNESIVEGLRGSSSLGIKQDSTLAGRPMTLEESIAAINESGQLGYAEEPFYLRWYRSLESYVEDTYIYDFLMKSFFEDSAADNGNNKVMFR